MNILLYLSQQVTIQGTAAVALPAGIIADYGGAAAPAGWLLCDGAAKSRSTYAALFTAIGTTFGAGDGSTTFNVPDCRGRSPVGVGAGSGLTARALNDQGGEETHLLNTSELPAHAHGVTDPGHTHTVAFPSTIVVDGAGNLYVSGAGSAGASFALSADANTTGVTVNSTGGDSPHNTMHPYIALTKIISTG